MLRPGFDRTRDKLCLISIRQTMHLKDIACSLSIRIFNVIHNEGNRAVARLLEKALTGSGDITILARTGRSGTCYNPSYLPAGLTVYNQIVPPHVPQPIQTIEMNNIVTVLRSSLPDPSNAA